jgi:drug/metabolite transporter superfamily protein YnfA
MPSISATLIELLTYIAPGFVVLYGIRRQANSLEKMFEAIAGPNGASALVALTITAMAFGLIIAAIAHIIIPWLARVTTLDRSAPVHVRQLDMARLYTRPAETIQAFHHHTRAYQSYANMAVALFISLAILFYNLWDKQAIDHWEFKIGFHSVITLLVLWGAVRYFKMIYRIAYALSQP